MEPWRARVRRSVSTWLNASGSSRHHGDGILSGDQDDGRRRVRFRVGRCRCRRWSRVAGGSIRSFGRWFGRGIRQASVSRFVRIGRVFVLCAGSASGRSAAGEGFGSLLCWVMLSLFGGGSRSVGGSTAATGIVTYWSSWAERSSVGSSVCSAGAGEAGGGVAGAVSAGAVEVGGAEAGSAAGVATRGWGWSGVSTRGGWITRSGLPRNRGQTIWIFRPLRARRRGKESRARPSEFPSSAVGSSPILVSSCRISSNCFRVPRTISCWVSLSPLATGGSVSSA